MTREVVLGRHEPRKMVSKPLDSQMSILYFNSYAVFFGYSRKHCITIKRLNIVYKKCYLLLLKYFKYSSVNTEAWIQFFDAHGGPAPSLSHDT